MLETIERQKPAVQIPNSASPHLMSKGFSDLQLLLVLLTANTLLSLKLIPPPVSNFLGKFPLTLASPKSWGLQGNPGFTFTASCIGLSRPSFRENLDTILASAAFLTCVGTLFHNLFLLSLTLKSETCDLYCQVLLLAGARTWP